MLAVQEDGVYQRQLDLDRSLLAAARRALVAGRLTSSTGGPDLADVC